MNSVTQPNILLIVLDACRFDHARDHAPNLRELGEEGTWFENAIAPATWTQPSHASIFTGQYPHEHGITSPSDSEIPRKLMDRLSDRGYSTHGVSGNGFVSPMWGFDTVFDTFRYTQTPEPFVDGMDTYTYLRNEVGERSALQVMGSITKRCLTHEHPLQSIANLGNVGINAVSRRYLPFLTRLPHQTFAPNPQHTYLPEKNTKLLTEIIEKRSTADQPFFTFVNYMDTHRPYQAPADLQRKHLGRELSKSEFERLNDKVGAPWGFVRLVQNDDVRDEDVETLRRLYAASVESVDRHIRRLLASLESADIREETIVIIVGDHGENLGETDEQGRTRFGHEASISDYVARVPMIVSTPATESQVDEIASIKDVYGYLLKASDPECSTADLSPQDLVSERAFCEYPALPDKTFYEKYPDIDRRYLSQRVETDSVAAYGDEWRIVIESDGTELAFRSQQQKDIEKAPADLVAAARETCETLSSMWSVDEITSQQTRDRLEELGYL